MRWPMVKIAGMSSGIDISGRNLRLHWSCRHQENMSQDSLSNMGFSAHLADPLKLPVIYWSTMKNDIQGIHADPDRSLYFCPDLI